MPHASITVGRYEVTPLCDGWAPLPLDDEVPGLEVDWEAERARFPWAFPENDATSWAWHVHAFLIRGPDGLVLVDTGIGHFGRSPFEVSGHLEEELESLRVSPTDLDDVILTREELEALMAGLLVSHEPPRGTTLFTDWLAANGAWLGGRYLNEVGRHFGAANPAAVRR